MNKLKKLGFTALAGSLVATSAYAGSLDVSGGASVKYQSQDEDEVTGNSFSQGKAITFSGAGDLDNGMALSYSYTMTDAAFSTQLITLDMGDSGSIGLGRGTSFAGIGKYDDVMPTAGEEVWDDTDTDDNGIVTQNSTNLLGYNGTFMGVGVSISYTNGGTGDTEKSGVITYDGAMEGLSLGFGQGDKQASDTQTAYAKYTVGSVTLGVQQSTIDFEGSTNDEERNHIAASFAVNENLSISYGRSDVDMNTATDEESSGISASYTMGSMTFGIVMNSTDNVAGTSGTDDAFKEASVSFAF
jgi:outer membrane protein OmpU